MTSPQSDSIDRLRRMRWLATSLLVAMLLLLATSVALESRHSWLQWIRAFAEAGAVGGLADWFAVTALFRRPLGLPIPHTAIIPANKNRIGESLGHFVVQNFLTPEHIVARLREHDAAWALARWLAAPDHSLAVASGIGDFLPTLLNGFSDDEIRQFFDRALTPQLLRLNVSRIAGTVLSVLTQDERHQVLLDRALQALEGWLVANQELIQTKFSEASRYTPSVVDRYIVRKFLQGIVALLHEVAASPQHELRAQFDLAVQARIHDLMSSEAHRRKGEALLRRLIEHVRSEGFYRSLWENIGIRLTADLRSDAPVITGYIATALAAVGERLLEEPGVRQRLNAWWLETARATVQRFGHQISRLISDVVKSWDAGEVSRKLELEIGRDLQYIRINGTFIGGAVGVLLHAGIRALT